jgi:prepilin-type N-terminal cleavage/methylation domain-containing protein
MNKYHVKAFTIMEVTITMMIAAILIGITYTAYSIISKSYISFNTKNSDMAVLVQLDRLLKRDLDRAEIMLKDNDGISLKNDVHEIKYKFEPGFITRTDVRIDTFKVKTDLVSTFFEGQPVNETSADEEQNRLDELEFTLLFQNEKIPYHYHKQYSSVNLIQRNPDAIN